MSKTRGKIFILSAPSGTGKTTILRKVMENIKGLMFSISHTTRQPRKGETNGVEYHFVDRHEFSAMRDKNDFLEFAEVHGNFYGTSRSAVSEQVEDGVDVILDIDVQGARLIRNGMELDCVYIFLAPPDIQELEKRLRGRGLDSDETVKTRLANALGEMKAMDEYDYLIVNDEIEIAVKMFESVILAERAKSGRGFNGTLLKKGENCCEK